MVYSLYLYIRYLIFTVLTGRFRYLSKDLYRYFLGKNRYIKGHPDGKRRKLALARSVKWILQAQHSSADAGMGSFHLVNGWSSSYPETTGYMIPTLLQYAEGKNDSNIKDAALRAADWLVEIQKPPGGWQGGRIGENRPAVVFNTAQVIRGLVPAYQLTKNKKYLDSAVKAAEWLCSIQDREGTWTKNALMNRARVYDSYVDFPLLMLHRETGAEKYRKHAMNNLDWIIEKKQQQNGWFEDCDNTIKRNHKPILHTIAYTIDGLLDSGIYLEEPRYVDAARKAADVLKEKFDHDGFLHGRYDKDWKGSEYMILTACAQMSVIWQKISGYDGNKNYSDSARQMNSLLVRLQMRNLRNESKNTLGALTGSFPLWGRYEPFAFPNWATKYFADALMLEDSQ